MVLTDLPLFEMKISKSLIIYWKMSRMVAVGPQQEVKLTTGKKHFDGKLSSQ